MIDPQFLGGAGWDGFVLERQRIEVGQWRGWDKHVTHLGGGEVFAQRGWTTIGDITTTGHALMQARAPEFNTPAREPIPLGSHRHRPTRVCVQPCPMGGRRLKRGD